VQHHNKLDDYENKINPGSLEKFNRRESISNLGGRFDLPLFGAVQK